MNESRRFYVVSCNDDDTVDVFLMPESSVDVPLSAGAPLRVVRGVVPWEGLENDIRARYTAWYETGEEVGRVPTNKVNACVDQA